jgi:hypothetical protein
MRLVIIYDLASIDYILSLKEESSLYYLYWAFSRNNRFLSFGKARLASLMGPAAIIKHYPNYSGTVQIHTWTEWKRF